MAACARRDGIPAADSAAVIQDVATVLAESSRTSGSSTSSIGAGRCRPYIRDLRVGTSAPAPMDRRSIAWDDHTEAVGGLSMVLVARRSTTDAGPPGSGWRRRSSQGWSPRCSCWAFHRPLSGRGRRRAGLLGAAVLVWTFDMFQIGAGTGLVPVVRNADMYAVLPWPQPSTKSA